MRKNKYFHHFNKQELWQIEEQLPRYFADEGLMRGNKAVCPFCGKADRSQIQESIAKPYTFICHRCTSPIGLIELHKRRTGGGFRQAATELASRYLIGYTGEASAPSNYSPSLPKVKKAEVVKDRKGCTKFDCLHIVNTARNHLDELFEKQELYRGLSKEELERFGVGFLPNWICPYPTKGIDAKKHPSKRVIYPLTLNNEIVGYEAKLPKTTTQSEQGEKEFKSSAVYSAEATNETFPLFHEKALDEEYCGIVESYDDAMMLSLYGTPTSATGGNNKLKGLMYRLATAKTRYIFIVLDNDELEYRNNELLEKGQAYSVRNKAKLLKSLYPYRTKEEEELDALCLELAKAGGYAHFPKEKLKRLYELANMPEPEKEKHIFLLPTIVFTRGEKDFNDMWSNQGKEGHFVYKQWQTYISSMANFINRFVEAHKKGKGNIEALLEQAFFLGWRGDSQGDDKKHRLNIADTAIDKLNRIIENRTTDSRPYYKKEKDPDGEVHIIKGRIGREYLTHEEQIKVQEVRLSFVKPTEDFVEAFNANQEKRIAKILPPSQAAFDELL